MLRPIETRDYAAIAVPSSFGRPPKLEWLSIASLVIDPEYQREITPRGRANVRRIAVAFDWAMFSPVIVAPAGSGQFAIVDGQHRTTAAKLCGIDRVPCVVIDVGKAIQAQAFKAINGNATRMHTLHLHHASVAAGDEKALRIADVCRKAGVTIVRNPTQSTLLKVGETVVVSTIGRAIERFGEAATVFGLKAIVNTGGGQPGPAFANHHLGRDRSPARPSRMVQGQAALRRARQHRVGRDVAASHRSGGAAARNVGNGSIRGVAGGSADERPFRPAREGNRMTIPSPRKFIEIALCFIVAAVFLSCFALVVVVMVVFAAVEGLVDRVRICRKRTR